VLHFPHANTYILALGIHLSCERENFVPTSSINFVLNINFMAVVLPSKQQYESTAKAPLGCSTAGAAVYAYF
jgi:hypothetical protein